MTRNSNARLATALRFPQMHVFGFNLEDDDPERFKELQDAFHSPVAVAELGLAIGFFASEKRAALEVDKLLKQFDLRTEKASTEECASTTLYKRDGQSSLIHSKLQEKHPPPGRSGLENKRRKLDDSRPLEKKVISLLSDSETESTTEAGSEDDFQLQRECAGSMKQAVRSETSGAAPSVSLCGRIVRVYSVQWYDECLKVKKIVPLKPYLVYAGKIIPKKVEASHSAATKGISILAKSEVLNSKSIWDRAKNDTPPPASHRLLHGHHDGHSRSQKPGLIRKETSDDEAEQEMPELPGFLKNPYSCFRPTPIDGPNEDFLEKLRKIKKIREIEGDQIGFRSYNAAIASIAAYPFKIKCRAEIQRLHACGPKFAQVWYVWTKTGMVEEIEEKESDGRFKALELFYGIYDVGAPTALNFYARGWRDLDDIVENW